MLISSFFKVSVLFLPYVSVSALPRGLDTAVEKTVEDEPIEDAPAVLYLPVEDEQVEPVTVELLEFTLRVREGGQAYVQDLGLSDYLKSQMPPDILDLQLFVQEVVNGNTVSYSGTATFLNEPTVDVLAIQKEALKDIVNQYWANTEGIGHFLSLLEVSFPGWVDLVNDVILRDFTVTVDGVARSEDLGLPGYFQSQMSVIYPSINNVLIEMFDYDGGNTVNYKGYANFSEPVVAEDVYALQFKILQNLDALNAYYVTTSEFNGELVVTKVSVDGIEVEVQGDKTGWLVGLYGIVFFVFFVFFFFYCCPLLFRKHCNWGTATTTVI